MYQENFNTWVEYHEAAIVKAVQERVLLLRGIPIPRSRTIQGAVGIYEKLERSNLKLTLNLSFETRLSIEEEALTVSESVVH